MNFLSPLANLLGLEVDHLADRLKRTVIVNAVMALFGLLGAGFLVAAGYIALAQQLGALYAALIFGGAFLLLALAVYLGAQLGEGRRKRELAQKRRSSEAGAFLTTATLAALPVLLRSPLLRTLGLPAAAIAAYLLVSNSGDDGEED